MATTIHPRTPEQIIEAYDRRLSVQQVAALADCKEICSFWHNRFGGCYRLNDDRLLAICALLHHRKAPIPKAHLLAGIENYHAYCQANAQSRIKAGIDSRDLVSFLKCSKLEAYIEAGLQARDRAAQQQQRTCEQAGTDADKRATIAAVQQAGLDFGRTLRQAYLDLARSTPDVQATLDDPRIRARMRELAKCGTGVSPVIRRGVEHE